MTDQVPSSDEEISLFDLFLVLLRQRKLIFRFIAIFFLAVVAIFFIYPNVKISRIDKLRMEKDLNSSADTEVMLPYKFSPNISNLVSDAELEKIVQNIITDPDFLIKAFVNAGYRKIANIDLYGDMEETQKRYQIYQYFVLRKSPSGQSLKKEEVLLENRKTSAGYLLSLRTFDPEMAKSVVENIFSEIERYADVVIRPLALKAVDDYEEILTSINPSQLVQASMISQYPRYSSARSYLNRTDTPFSRLSDMQIISKPQTVKSIRASLIPKLSIVLLAAFFASLLLAFIVDAVQSLFSDEEAMSRLKRAMAKER